MARITVEIGQSFYKTDSHRIVWTVDSFNKNTEPVHVRLTRHHRVDLRIVGSTVFSTVRPLAATAIFWEGLS